MTSSSESDEIDDNEFEFVENNTDDTLKILVTTDNHLGYMEKDADRGEDSYKAFEEALRIAEQEQVDFILLGGDLFHENKPSRDCLARCQRLLRQYCFGIKPIEFSIISDEHVNFGHTTFPYANFNDPNLNISIPVFSIHGNHDDPTGMQNLCALDILASAGLVNYFGKCNTNLQQDIQVNPILIEKGQTKLAIYGIGAIKDERLHHMFEKGVVKFNKPSEETDRYFNIFVIHQNRVVHGKKNYIPETFLPDDLDLVVWGHEHECRLRPEYNELKRFFVTQPGSTVITSLCESEAVPKKVGILKINRKKFKMEEVALTTNRPFVFEHISLQRSGLSKTDKNLEVKIEQFCAKKVEEMIKEASRINKNNEPTKPLIRLKVDYTDYDMINENRFAQKFFDRVANAKNILNFYRKQNEDRVDITLDPKASKYLGAKNTEHVKVEDLVLKYFKEADDQKQLYCLTERGLCDAIKEYVEKDERDAISELINFQIDKTQKYLRSLPIELHENQIDNEIKKFHDMRIKAEDEELGEIKEVLSKVHEKSKNKPKTNLSDDDFMVSDDDLATSKKPSKTLVNDTDDEDNVKDVKTSSLFKKTEVKDEFEELDENLTLTKRGGKRGGGRGSRGGGTGRGRGRGRGGATKEPVVTSTAIASTSATTTQKKQTQLTSFMMPKQEPKSQIESPLKKSTTKSSKYASDEDSDVEVLPTRSNVTIKQEPLTARASNVSVSATQSQRASTRANTTRKIKYEDDSDDESQQITFNSSSNTRNKTKQSQINDDDDDDDYNIFKKVSDPKRRKL